MEVSPYYVISTNTNTFCTNVYVIYTILQDRVWLG